MWSSAPSEQTASSWNKHYKFVVDRAEVTVLRIPGWSILRF
jgi:hypothetical protein